jgi:ATP-binding cassette, subfamily C (CFTR/MRP), member 1
MSEGFCGEGGPLIPGWTSLLEDFTPCFEAVTVTALPLYVLLLVGLPLAVFRTVRNAWRPHAFPSHWMHTAQLAAGAAVSLMTFSRLLMLLVDQKTPPVAPYQLYADLSVLLGWLLGTTLWLYAGMRGVYYDPAAVLFCALQFCVYLVALRTRVLQITAFYQEVGPEFVAFCVEFAVMLVYVTLCVFFAHPPPAYWEQRAAQEERSFSVEERSNLFSVIFFSWLNSVLKKGSGQPLEHEDLLALAEKEQAGNIRNQFEEAWEIEMRRPADKRSLVRALHRAFSLPVYIAFLFKLVQDLLLFVGPWLLNRIIQYVQDPSIPTYWGFVYSFALFFSNALQSVALHQYFHRCLRTGMVLRSAVVTCIYKKALRLSVTARQTSTTGEITNLMSVDAQRMQDTLTYLAMLWSAPLQITIALTALYFVLDASIFAGFGRCPWCCFLICGSE